MPGVADATGDLAGVRVLVPRPPHQAAELSDRIRAAGGEPVEAPTIAVAAGDEDDLDAAVAGLVAGRFVGLCLTSANGVAALEGACARTGTDPATAVAPVRWVGAVGPRTAARLTALTGRRPEVVPARATGAELGAAVPPGEGPVLLPRGDRAGDDLVAALRAAGYTPREVVAYRTVTRDRLPERIVDDLRSGRIGLVAATSGSTVRGLVAALGGPPVARVVTIGPVTSAVCAELGVPVAAEADPHDLDGLVAALVAVVRH